ncbi:hypothetical protein ACFC1T_11865 [Kitasatospora sp. NPDC056076]|uniref:hypothetical protein n=1 Tax=Kitasatospora sp. NPDC056076 TaxID=3345703 RepID=UPI0035E1C153
MGTDIHGFIEYRCTHGAPVDDADEDTVWSVALDLYALYCGRNYDEFGCLFGVRNLAGFRPLAPDRGLPEELPEETRTAFGASEVDFHSPTWISWAELAAVDWDEPAERADERVHVYGPGPDGALVRHTKYSVDHGGRVEGDEWWVGDQLHRIARLTRRDAVPPNGPWAPVFAVMRTLADLHGPDNVRLTVWFDS